jgi:hypothetical protein
MKNLLLGIIAINLTIISINMTLRSVEPVNAQVSGMDYYDLITDLDFKRAVKSITKDVVNQECFVSLKEIYNGIQTNLYCN